MVGQTIDRYRVLEKLGEGGMGAVYAVEHLLLRKRMAMKLLHAELGDDAEAAARFHNEAIAASRIGQENIVSIFDFGWTGDGQAYLVMEELRGRLLGSALAAEGAFSVTRTLRVAWQVAKALEAAHAAAIVHRDLKPDNVMLVAKGNLETVKILDFGVSKVSLGPLHLTRVGAVLGTPSYMSPEQAAGRPVDHRTDVYAFGLLVYEMLEGRPPFVDPNPVQVLLMHQSAPVPELSVPAPEELRELVRTALAKRPEDRPATMGACLTLLVSAARGGGQATPRPAPKRPTPSPRPTPAGEPRLRLLPAPRPAPTLTPEQAYVASRLAGCPLTPTQLVHVSGLPGDHARTIIRELLDKRVIDVG